MPFSKKTLGTLKKLKRYECCEICATKCPRLQNGGLEAVHIISEDAGGLDTEDNALVLCAHCHQVFDRFLKGKITKAIQISNKFKKTAYKVPENWITAEGRRHKNDEI